MNFLSFYFRFVLVNNAMSTKFWLLTLFLLIEKYNLYLCKKDRRSFSLLATLFPKTSSAKQSIFLPPPLPPDDARNTNFLSFWDSLDGYKRLNLIQCSWEKIAQSQACLRSKWFNAKIFPSHAATLVISCDVQFPLGW